MPQSGRYLLRRPTLHKPPLNRRQQPRATRQLPRFRTPAPLAGDPAHPHRQIPLTPTTRAISRETVDGDRPNPRAIARPDKPAANPRLIRSRSSHDNRYRECNTRRRRNHASSRNLTIVLADTPNTAPTAPTDIPPSTITNARRC